MKMKTIKLTDYELFLLQNALNYYGNFVDKSQSNTSVQDAVDKLQDKVDLIGKGNSLSVLCDI